MVAFLCLLCFNVFSQQLQVEYYENIIIKKPDELKQLPAHVRKDFEPNRFVYTLTYVDGYSLYKNNDFSKLLNTEEQTTEEILDLGSGEKVTFVGTANESIDKYKVFEKMFFKDYLNRKVYAELYTSEKNQIVDNLFDWNWEITNEEKQISGYTCKKAISKLYGYNYEAWYTDEIPVSSGPEKFDGLPGLILYVHIGATEFIAKSVKIMDSPTTLTQPNFEGKIYTFDELIKKSNSKPVQFKTSITKDSDTSFKRTSVIKFE